MRRKRTKTLTQAAMVASLYIVLTLISNALGLSNGAIQLRLSESLTILPYYSPAAIPGLFAGCLTANILTGAMPLDVIFGSLATLLGALGTYGLRKYRFLAAVPPILANTIMIPLILQFVYRFEGSLSYFMVTVGIGELLSCGVLGMALLCALGKYQRSLFGTDF